MIEPPLRIVPPTKVMPKTIQLIGTLAQGSRIITDITPTSGGTSADLSVGMKITGTGIPTLENDTGAGIECFVASFVSDTQLVIGWRFKASGFVLSESEIALHHVDFTASGLTLLTFKSENCTCCCPEEAIKLCSKCTGHLERSWSVAISFKIVDGVDPGANRIPIGSVSWPVVWPRYQVVSTLNADGSLTLVSANRYPGVTGGDPSVGAAQLVGMAVSYASFDYVASSSSGKIRLSQTVFGSVGQTITFDAYPQPIFDHTFKIYSSGDCEWSSVHDTLLGSASPYAEVGNFDIFSPKVQITTAQCNTYSIKITSNPGGLTYLGTAQTVQSLGSFLAVDAHVGDVLVFDDLPTPFGVSLVAVATQICDECPPQVCPTNLDFCFCCTGNTKHRPCRIISDPVAEAAAAQAWVDCCNPFHTAPPSTCCGQVHYADEDWCLKVTVPHLENFGASDGEFFLDFSTRIVSGDLGGGGPNALIVYRQYPNCWTALSASTGKANLLADYTACDQQLIGMTPLPGPFYGQSLLSMGVFTDPTGPGGCTFGAPQGFAQIVEFAGVACGNLCCSVLAPWFDASCPQTTIFPVVSVTKGKCVGSDHFMVDPYGGRCPIRLRCMVSQVGGSMFFEFPIQLLSANGPGSFTYFNGIFGDGGEWIGFQSKGVRIWDGPGGPSDKFYQPYSQDMDGITPQPVPTPPWVLNLGSSGVFGCNLRFRRFYELCANKLRMRVMLDVTYGCLCGLPGGGRTYHVDSLCMEFPPSSTIFYSNVVTASVFSSPSGFDPCCTPSDPSYPCYPYSLAGSPDCTASPQFLVVITEA